MESQSSAQIRTGQGYTYLKISGVIDEHNDLTSLTPRLVGRVVVLNLEEIHRINSYGVRDWVNWLGELRQRGHELVMVRCSTAIIAQVNMVTNFCADAVILSFYAPYYNPATDESCNKLLHVDEFIGQPSPGAPVFHENGEELEFDDFEASYFAFIRAMGNIKASARLQHLAVGVNPQLPQIIMEMSAGNFEQAGGAVQTAAIGGVERSGGFPGLMETAQDIEKASAAATQQVPVRPPMAAAGVPAAAPPKSGGLKWIPYVLMFIAMLVVALLLYFVLTLQ